MMETQIFYWTGCVIWWAICLCVISAAIVAPVVSFLKAKKFLWQWRWAAITAETGFTHEDVVFALSGVDTPNGVTAEQMMAWVEQVKERGSVVRKRS